MIPKGNARVVEYRAHARHLKTRFLRLVTQLPMVAVLGCSLVSVGLTEQLGGLWIGIETLLLTILVVRFAMALRAAKRQSQSVNLLFARPISLSILFIAISLALSIWHAQEQARVQTKVDFWQSKADAAHKTTSAQSSSPWKAVAIRAIIDGPLRYRRTNNPGFAIPEDLVDANGNATQVHKDQSSDASASQPIGWQTLTTVRITHARVDGEWQSRDLLMQLVVDGKHRGFFPGDPVELYCHWRLPPPPSNPGQPDFRRRFAQLGGDVLGRAESIERSSLSPPASNWRLDRWLAKLSDASLQSIERYVVLDQCEFAAALVLGHREQVEWRLQEELLATGTIHMLSISGMHIEMVALSLLIFGTWLRIPRTALLVSVVAITISYSLLCGANPPVIRATMMLIGVCTARLLGWQLSSLNILAFAGVTLMFSRTSVAFEIGTQLSFLAVAVLILSARTIQFRTPPLQRLLEERESKTVQLLRATYRVAWDLMRTSFWVCFLTAPLVWHGFHVISPIAIVLNVLLWIPMFIALLSGLAMILIGWIPPAGWGLGILCGVSLWMVEQTVWMGEAIPYGHFWLRSPPLWWLYGFYAIAIATTAWRGVQRLKQRRFILLTLGVWFAIGLAIDPLHDLIESMKPNTQRKMVFTFLDVGHGTCTILETPDNQTWLYDSGRLGDHERSYQCMADALWYLRTDSIDTLFLSHADSDHFNGASGVFTRFWTKRIIGTEHLFVHPNQLLRDCLSNAKRHGISMERWHRGDQYQSGLWRVYAVHPEQGKTYESDNANSLCIMVEFAGRRVLLPGDLEPPGTRDVISAAPVQVDVLMAPHHGSLSSKADKLLRWCQPKTVVISGGSRSLSPRVTQLYSATDRKLWFTAKDHAIRVEIDAKGGITTSRWRIDRWQSIDTP